MDSLRFVSSMFNFIEQCSENNIFIYRLFDKGIDRFINSIVLNEIVNAIGNR